MSTVRRKLPSEQTWANVLKAARAAVRLKHSLRADEELNEVLPRLQEEYTRAINRGQPYELDTASLVRELDEDPE
jgi:hypothetical protein